ncbi:MAG TPA: GntR family transcriptional regulator [Anaerovoracaceae bacterium]|nr:GntR family transcriptional regulator [Anaerovoracaceae bacterium]
MAKKIKDGVDYRAPMYLQLREVIRTKIEEGEFLPGEAIPSENALAQQYGLNRMTVRNAISTLVNEGLLIRVHGKGVYVIGNKLEQKIQTQGGFTEATIEKDRKWDSKILQKSYREAGEKYAALFGVEKQSRIYFIRKMFYLNGEPYSIEESHIPEWVVPNLDKIDLAVFSIDEIYPFHDIRVAREEQRLTVAVPDPMDARILKLDPGVAVLILSYIKYNDDNRAVEDRTIFTRADKCNFKVSYRRR